MAVINCAAKWPECSRTRVVIGVRRQWGNVQVASRAQSLIRPTGSDQLAPERFGKTVRGR